MLHLTRRSSLARTYSWLRGTLLLVALLACGGEDLSVDGPVAGGGPGGSGAGGSAGAQVGAGQGGAAGSAAGAAGVSGTSGQSGSAGDAGSAGTPGGAGGDAGAAGAGGQAGAAGVGGDAGVGGAAGGAGVGGASGVAGAAGAAGSTTTSPDCLTLHVSPGGDDKNTGCSDSPLRTISEASVRSASGGPSKVKVCVGTFDEHVVIKSEITVVGSVDCATWQSTLPDAFDPDKDVGKLTTHLVNTSFSEALSSRTVRLSAAVKVQLSGLDIKGHSLPKAPSWAVDASTSGASLTVTRCALDGGGGHVSDATSAASTGLAVGPGVLAAVQDSVVRGGSGVSTGDTGVGSVGVRIDAGAASASQPVSLDNVRVDGGSGQGSGVPGTTSQASGSIGVQAAGPVKVTASVLRGGSGSVFLGASSRAMFATAAADAPLVPFDVSDSELDGGTGLTRQKGPTDAVYGVAYALHAVHAAGTLSRSRLYGGEPTLALSANANAAPPQAVGAILRGGSSVVMINNVIVGGNQTASNGAGVVRAVVVSDGATATLLHNTLLAGAVAPGGANSAALYIGTGSNILRFDNNLLGVADAPPGTAAYHIFIQHCPEDTFKTFAGNTFLYGQPAIGRYNSNGLACAHSEPAVGDFTSFAQLADLGVVTKLEPGTNRVVAASCGDPSECVTVLGCKGSSSCQQTFFGSVPGRTQLDQGWAPLATSIPCAVALQDDPLAEVPTDAAGHPRTGSVTPGAIEQDTCSGL